MKKEDILFPDFEQDVTASISGLNCNGVARPKIPLKAFHDTDSGRVAVSRCVFPWIHRMPLAVVFLTFFGLPIQNFNDFAGEQIRGFSYMLLKWIHNAVAGQRGCTRAD